MFSRQAGSEGVAEKNVFAAADGKWETVSFTKIRKDKGYWC